MAKFSVLTGLLKQARIKKFRVSKVIKSTALLAGGGALGGFGAAPPGGRRQGAKEGATAGAVAVGVGLATRFLFRRIRGRIVRIKVKR